MVGWRKWLRGLIHVEGDQRWKIKPYRKFIQRDFPNDQLKNIFRLEWKTIFEKMTETPGLVIPAHEHEIDDAFVESSYASATRYLRENYSYIFQGPAGSTESFLIGTWSRKVRRSEVLKHGTPEDKAKLAPPNPKNRKRRGGVRKAGVRRKKGRLLAGTEHR